jgi:hypothetical protein
MGPPFHLAYPGTTGPHPLEGGVVVFGLPGQVITVGTERTPAQDGWYSLRGVLEAETVRLTLRSAPGDPGRTELTLHADLRPGVRRNVNMGVGMGALALLPTGLVGIGLSAAAGVAGVLGAVGAGALLAAVAVPAGLLLGARGYGAMYRSYVGRAERELDTALAAVEGVLRSTAVFGAPAADVASNLVGPGVVPGAAVGASLSPDVSSLFPRSQPPTP